LKAHQLQSLPLLKFCVRIVIYVMEVDGKMIDRFYKAPSRCNLVTHVFGSLALSESIAGGIGAVLPWVPIKAYRPCPTFIARGGNYQRSGQGLDEIAFGRSNIDK
jgi:hypothetical protein